MSKKRKFIQITDVYGSTYLVECVDDEDYFDLRLHNDIDYSERVYSEDTGNWEYIH